MQQQSEMDRSLPGMAVNDGIGAAFARRVFDLTQTRLIWRSCVSAPMAGSNTVEGQKRRSRTSASVTNSFGRRCACFCRLAVRAAGLANRR